MIFSLKRISPSLVSAAIFGLGGIGFSLGNILFARGLPAQEFAIFTLALAFTQISGALGPLGVDVIVNRHSVQNNFKLLNRSLLNSVSVSIALSLIAFKFYALPELTVLLLFLFCIGISINKIASSIHQSLQEFGRSLFLSQLHNGMITVVAVIVLFFDLKTAIWPLLMLTITYFVTSYWAWRRLINNSKRINFESTSNPPWNEAWVIVGSGALTAVLILLERFTIPQFIDIRTLAIFAVLAAIVGSPFRILQMAVGHTLIPRFRAAHKIQEKRTLIFNEGKMIFLMIIFSSGAVWFLAPLIVTWFLDDKYILSHELILAMIFSGSAKVLYSFASSPIIAAGNRSDLFRLHLLSWATIIVATSGAYFGAQWGGLFGLVMGVGIGWLFQSIVAIFIVISYFTLSKTKIY